MNLNPEKRARVLTLISMVAGVLGFGLAVFAVWSGSWLAALLGLAWGVVAVGYGVIADNWRRLP